MAYTNSFPWTVSRSCPTCCWRSSAALWKTSDSRRKSCPEHRSSSPRFWRCSCSRCCSPARRSRRAGRRGRRMCAFRRRRRSRPRSRRQRPHPCQRLPRSLQHADPNTDAHARADPDEYTISMVGDCTLRVIRRRATTQTPLRMLSARTGRTLLQRARRDGERRYDDRKS